MKDIAVFRADSVLAVTVMPHAQIWVGQRLANREVGRRLTAPVGSSRDTKVPPSQSQDGAPG